MLEIEGLVFEVWLPGSHPSDARELGEMYE